MGAQAFHEWADRIISGAILPGGTDDKEKFVEDQKFALANMLMHLGAHDSHKPDAHFMHALRKSAINQVAYAMMEEIKQKRKSKEQPSEVKVENPST